MKPEEPKKSTWINLLNDWFADGRCKNRTGAPLSHRIEILRPEEVVPTM